MASIAYGENVYLINTLIAGCWVSLIFSGKKTAAGRGASSRALLSPPFSLFLILLEEEQRWGRAAAQVCMVTATCFKLGACTPWLGDWVNFGAWKLEYILATSAAFLSIKMRIPSSCRKGEPFQNLQVHSLRQGETWGSLRGDKQNPLQVTASLATGREAVLLFFLI